MSKQSERDTLRILRKMEVITLLKALYRPVVVPPELLREAAELGITPLDIE